MYLYCFPFIVWTMPQASCWGLMEAVERFDPTKGTKFGTYAVHWIRCKCSEVAAAERDVIYVPYEAAQRRAEVANAQSALKTALDRLALLAAQAFLLPGASTCWNVMLSCPGLHYPEPSNLQNRNQCQAGLGVWGKQLLPDRPYHRLCMILCLLTISIISDLQEAFSSQELPMRLQLAFAAPSPDGLAQTTRLARQKPRLARFVFLPGKELLTYWHLHHTCPWLCREPTAAEIGEALGLSVRQVERSLSLRGMSSVFMSAAPPGNLARKGKAAEVPFP